MVEKIMMQVEGTKEGNEIGMYMLKLARAIKNASADGWQAGQDIPEIVINTLQPLMAAIEGYDKISDEAKLETAAFVKGITVPLMGIPFLFIKKEETVA